MLKLKTKQTETHIEYDQEQTDESKRKRKTRKKEIMSAFPTDQEVADYGSQDFTKPSPLAISKIQPYAG